MFLAIVFIIPYEIYDVQTNNVFPALYLLIMIFGVAFIYIVIETVYLWIRDKERLTKIKELKLEKGELKEFFNQITLWDILLYYLLII